MNSDEHKRNKKPVPALKILTPIHQLGLRQNETGPSGSSGSSSDNDFRSRDRNNGDRNGVQEETTCLFCFHRVRNVEDPKTSEIVKAVCHHFDVNRHQIPNDCNEARFCDTCKDAVLKIWKAEQTIQEVRASIANESSIIEEAVRDAVILTNELEASPSSNSIEAKKFKPLRDMILKSYRNKLMIERRSREAAVSERQEKVVTITQSPQAVMKDKSSTRQYDARNANQVFQIPDEEVTASTTVFYPQVDTEVGAEPVGIADGRSGSSNKKQGGNETDADNLLRNSEEGEDSLQGVYNPNSCSPVTTEVDPAAPIVKQEPTSSAWDVTFPILEPQGHSRVLQIRRHNSQKQKFGKTGSVVNILKKRKYEFTCRVCNAKFRFKNLLYAHKRSHTQEELDKYTETRKCDICDRIVKGGNGNLRIHKFSHKNKDEKLADTWAQTVTQRSKESKKRGVRKQKMRKTIKTSSINNLPSTDAEKIHRCPVCDRPFKRKCHLGNHLRIHYGSSPKTRITSTATTENSQMPNLESMLIDDSHEVITLDD